MGWCTFSLHSSTFHSPQYLFKSGTYAVLYFWAHPQLIKHLRCFPLPFSLTSHQLSGTKESTWSFSSHSPLLFYLSWYLSGVHQPAPSGKQYWRKWITVCPSNMEPTDSLLKARKREDIYKTKSRVKVKSPEMSNSKQTLKTDTF